ncbi:MAG: hypothetical protein C4321_09270, partial [Chloroflexota bacterium]
EKETQPRGRASVNYDWIEGVKGDRFQNHLGPTLGDRYLRNLVAAANGRFLGLHEDDYTRMDWGSPTDVSRDSALFGRVEGREAEDILRGLGVANPDQLAARLLGTALPVVAEKAHPRASSIAISRGMDDAPKVEMYMSDPSGNLVLSLSRNYYLYPEGIDPVSGEMSHVHNAIFRLQEPLQGQGLGTAMYASQNRMARDLGAKTIQMTANLEVGSYAWPLLGFDFRFPQQARRFRNRLELVLAGLVASGQLDRDEANKLIAEKVPELQRAWEFASFSIPEDMGRGLSDEWRRVGKLVLLNANYPAERDLGDPEAKAVMTKTIKRRLQGAGLLS